MYSKQEVAQLRQSFWTAFGQYMNPILSSEGEKVNWINYKTGEKHMAFRMEADKNAASIAIECTHRDAGVRQLYFAQLEQFRALLESELGETWLWQPDATDDTGRKLSRVVKEIKDVSIFRKEDWPALISFFKPRIMSLDAFWSQAKYVFEALR